ncbi:MAG: SMC-Scp complex subunit ScpB [Omnitrophica WOR_2 bacterium RIFCSPLOWO2_12_FULL_51_8]|nr:MAG: SMC-Scp complex subunit ScpB [Omnitrophica WOR_2 bacterium RIFCSPLOWO2_12_FULL_51_8]
MSDNNTKAVIEALLFISEKPLTIEQVRNVLGHLDAEQARLLIEELSAGYQRDGRGLRVVEVAGGFRMITPAELSPFLRKLYKEKRVERLSKPALETLAIIAYKQPITRLEIELIRNVNVDGIVSALLEKELIRVAGVRKAPGRPRVYGTTKYFLEYFGLKSLDDLPKMEDFSQMAKDKEARLLNDPDPAPVPEARGDNVPEETDGLERLASKN